MGPLEKLLRSTNVDQSRQVERAYGNAVAGKILVDARRSLSLSLYQTQNFLRDIFSEAIEAASALGL